MNLEKVMKIEILNKTSVIMKVLVKLKKLDHHNKLYIILNRKTLKRAFEKSIR